MDNVTLMKGVLDKVLATGDYTPLIDRLADDAVLKLTISDGTPFSGEHRGKQAVVEFLLSDEVVGFRQEMPPQYFGSGDRVVVLGVESFEIKKSGVSVRNREYADVFDFRDGMITRYLIIQNTSEIADAYRGTAGA